MHLKMLRWSKSAQLCKSKSSMSQGSISEIRIAVFGDGRVGKTSLIKRFLYNIFVDKYNETIEDVYRKDVTCNNQVCDLSIIDTAGNYQFPAMRKLAIQHSDGFIIVYSIDSPASFAEAKRLRNIVVEIKETTDVPIVLVGNKIDPGYRRISRVDAAATMNSWGSKVQHIETSAKTDHNVELVFNSLLGMIDEIRNEKMKINSLKTMSRSISISAMRASLRSRSGHSSRRPTRPQSLSYMPNYIHNINKKDHIPGRLPNSSSNIKPNIEV